MYRSGSNLRGMDPSIQQKRGGKPVKGKRDYGVSENGKRVETRLHANRFFLGGKERGTLKSRRAARKKHNDARGIIG